MILLASSGTEYGIRGLIKQYFYRSSADDVVLIPSKVDSRIFHIEIGGTKVLQHFQVRTKGKRLRFEQLEDTEEEKNQLNLFGGEE